MVGGSSVGEELVTFEIVVFDDLESSGTGITSAFGFFVCLDISIVLGGAVFADIKSGGNHLELECLFEMEYLISVEMFECGYERDIKMPFS